MMPDLILTENFRDQRAASAAVGFL